MEPNVQPEGKKLRPRLASLQEAPQGQPEKPERASVGWYIPGLPKGQSVLRRA